MPGRHNSGGPLGGGSRGGGFGGGGGGFRRGGGGWDGGGWGGGGGWRRGGWGWGGWRPMRPWFGGWGFFPRMPFWGFGPRLGCGGGIGCLFLAACLLFAFLSMFSPGFFGNLLSFNRVPNFNYPGNNQNNSGPNSNSSIQTQTASDLAELHTAFDSRIPNWQSDLANNESRSISPSDAGLTADNNTKDVIYGKCGTAFYLYVVEMTHPENVPGADSEGYVYTTASSPGACHPPQYLVTDSENVGGGWYFADMKSQVSAQ